MRDPDVCDCGSTYELEADNEQGFVIIHFQDCALIQSRLVDW
jgi:hypothetical protein